METITETAPRALEDYSLLRLELQQLQEVQAGISKNWKYAGSRMGETGRQLLDFYGRRISAQATELAKIAQAIDACPDPFCRDLLRAHFENGISWEQLADDFCYSLRQLFRYRNIAIEQFVEQMKGTEL